MSDHRPGTEPDLIDLLRDPITSMLMECDHVSMNDLQHVIDEARDRLAHGRRPEPRD